MDIHLTAAADPASNVKQAVAFLGPVLVAGVGAAAGFAASYFQSTAQERRKLVQDQRLARLTLYYEFSRVAEITDNQFGFVLGGNGFFIWVPVFRSLLPTNDSREMLQRLTPSDAAAATNFFYSYQEHINYILGNALGSQAGHDLLKEGVTAIGYDFRDKVKFRNLLWSLHIIEGSASRAVSALGSSLLRQKPEDGSLAKIVADTQGRGRRTAQFPAADGPYVFPD